MNPHVLQGNQNKWMTSEAADSRRAMMSFAIMFAKRVFPVLACWFCCSFLTGCKAYVTPGRGADLATVGVPNSTRIHQTDTSIYTALDKKPLAALPTNIAVVRVQAPGYRDGFGEGRYSVITTRDVEKDEQVARIEKLPMIGAVAPVNRLLLNHRLESDEQLRHAAAQLHADMTFIYTFDTQFYLQDLIKPLTVISLGLSPNKTARVVTTASGVLMDTRNGYIYGLVEATEEHKTVTNMWSSEDAIAACQRQNESRVFEKLIGEYEKMWKGVVDQFLARPPARP